MSSSARHHSTFWTLTELARPQIVNCPATHASRRFSRPDIAEFCVEGSGKKSGPAMRGRGLTISKCAAIRSVAKEQPKQNDHRDWHTQKPQQNSASHHLLLVFAFARATPARRALFRQSFGISGSFGPILNRE